MVCFKYQCPDLKIRSTWSTELWRISVKRNFLAAHLVRGVGLFSLVTPQPFTGSEPNAQHPNPGLLEMFSTWILKTVTLIAGMGECEHVSVQTSSSVKHGWGKKTVKYLYRLVAINRNVQWKLET